MIKNKFIDDLIARGVIVINYKPVHVRGYDRNRFGKQEYVCQHWRSLPRGKRAF